MADSPPTDTVEHDTPDAAFWRPSEQPDRPPAFPPRPSEWGGPLERFVDRVHELRGDPRVGVAALLVVALAAGFIWYRLGAGDSSSSTTRRPPATSSRTATAPAADSTAAGSSAASSGSSGATKKGARVTVHVAGAMDRVQRLRHARERDRGARRDQRAGAVDERAQVMPVDEAHDQIGGPVALARGVDGDHVRVLDRGRGLRLLLEPGPKLLVARQFRGDQLQRDGALEAQLGRPVDHSHAALTGNLVDSVTGECLAGL